MLRRFLGLMKISIAFEVSKKTAHASIRLVSQTLIAKLAVAQG